MTSFQFLLLLIIGILLFQHLRKADPTKLRLRKIDLTKLRGFFWPEPASEFVSAKREHLIELTKKLFLVAALVAMGWYVARPSTLSVIWTLIGIIAFCVVTGAVAYFGKWWADFAVDIGVVSGLLVWFIRDLGKGSWWSLIAIFFWPTFVGILRYWWKYRTAESRRGATSDA